MLLFKRIFLLQIRKQKRYRAKDGVCVAYAQDMPQYQINDISMGGLSFYYVDKGKSLWRWFRELRLIRHNRLCLGGLSFEIVSNNITGEMMFRNQKVRRKSVRFNRMSHVQKQHLKAFISSSTK